MQIEDILARIGYVRNQAHLSARELSLRMGMCEQYMGRVESGKITLQMSKLLEILEICNFSIERFFSQNIRDYEIDNALCNKILSLTTNKKKNLLELLSDE